jgi:hypothetical protein
VDIFQKFFDMTFMQDIMHTEKDEMYAADVWVNLHVTETNAKLLLQQLPPCVNSFLLCNPSPWKTGNYNKVPTFQLQFGTKWMWRASQTFENLVTHLRTEPNISASVPVKSKHWHRWVFVERLTVFHAISTRVSLKAAKSSIKS